MKYTKALRYEVKLRCATPLRTGGAEGSSAAILRRQDDTPILQGASLAGALRNWRNDDSLFGTGENEGALIVSDIVFSKTETISRPKIKINEKNGTAQNRALTFVSALPTGTTGSFTLTWRGTEDTESARQNIEQYLSALHYGRVRLGAQKANGFGTVTLQVCRRAYDLTVESDRRAWLDGGPVAEAVDLEPCSDAQVTFHVTAKTPAILVKSSIGTGQGQNGVDTQQYRENGVCLVPGSSIKGAMRGQITRFAPYFGVQNEVERLFGTGGHQGTAGMFRFGDAVFSQLKESGPIVRIQIDRFTGCAFREKLRSESNAAGTLEWDILVPAHEKQGCALILYALRDLGLGLYTLGSEGSLGKGRFDSLTVEICGPEGAGQLRCEAGQVVLSDPAGMLEDWQKVLGGGKE